MPAPVPPGVTVSDSVSTKLAVAVDVWSMLTVQVGVVPVQAPAQRSKTDPGVGAAVSVTRLWKSKVALHVVPQLIPGGSEVTVPVPFPRVNTLREGFGLNAAATPMGWSMRRVQVGVDPPQPPPQRRKYEPGPGVAFKVTTSFMEYALVQVVWQLIPGGLEVMLPVPKPVTCT